MKIKPSVFLPICLLLTAVYPHKLKSQPLTKPGTGEIGTVQFFRENSPLSFPIIDQTSAQKIELRFDIFGIDKEIFNYKIILCDYNWETVDLDPFDYMEGYEENYLEPFGQ